LHSGATLARTTRAISSTIDTAVAHAHARYARPRSATAPHGTGTALVLKRLGARRLTLVDFTAANDVIAAKAGSPGHRLPFTATREAARRPLKSEHARFFAVH